MNVILTATYDTKDTLRNVSDDLVSTGIPREKINAHPLAEKACNRWTPAQPGRTRV